MKHILPILLCVGLNSCCVPVTTRYASPQSQSSGFHEYRIQTDHDGGFTVSIRDSARDLRNMHILSYALTDAHGNLIPLRCPRVTQVHDGEDVRRASHLAFMTFSLDDPNAPKAITRLAAPITFQLTVEIDGNKVVSSGTYVIKSRTWNLMSSE